MPSASASSSTTTTTTTTDYEYPALCIPRALGEITHEELYAIIKKSGLGEISKIVMRPKEFVLPKWERTNSSESHQNNRSAASTETDTNPQNSIVQQYLHLLQTMEHRQSTGTQISR
jgi:hypothetical protein